MCTSMLMLQGDGMRLFRAIRAAITAFNHSLFEPQCSNATDSEVHLTADSRQCMEELEHAASDYSTDCNNSSAMTRELPLSDESRQWIAKDTCSGRDSADTCYMHKFEQAMHTPLSKLTNADDVIDSIAFDGSSRHGLEQLIAHQQQMMETALINVMLQSICSKSSNVNQQYECMNEPDALISNYLPCSSAHTPTAEPQATTHLEHIPAVKREYV